MPSSRFRLTLEEEMLSAPDHGLDSFSYEEVLCLRGGPREMQGIMATIDERMEMLIERSHPAEAATPQNFYASGETQDGLFIDDGQQLKSIQDDISVLTSLDNRIRLTRYAASNPEVRSALADLASFVSDHHSG